jgi:hypothetical protein
MRIRCSFVAVSLHLKVLANYHFIRLPLPNKIKSLLNNFNSTEVTDAILAYMIGQCRNSGRPCKDMGILGQISDGVFMVGKDIGTALSRLSKGENVFTGH